MKQSGMDRRTADLVVTTFLKEARRRLTKAVKLACAAEARADKGAGKRAVRTALRIEPLLYEAAHFVNTASIVHRLWGR
jgi:hypothetical protein